MEVVEDLGQVAFLVASPDYDAVASRALDTSLNLRTVECGEERGATRSEVDGMGESGSVTERRRSRDGRVNVQAFHVGLSSEPIESGGEFARRRCGDGEGRTIVGERKGDPSSPSPKSPCFDDWKAS
jgi:hypothetical protein